MRREPIPRLNPFGPTGRITGMNPIVRTLNTFMGARMAQSGRFVQLHTLGRASGEWRATPVGYEHAGDGALYVGAGSARAHWAHNLLANPVCRASLGGQTLTYRAEHLLEDARDAALRAIKGRYGPGMADQIGGGPVFRLVPLEEQAGA